jgi:hypothetical protein
MRIFELKAKAKSKTRKFFGGLKIKKPDEVIRRK